MDAADPLTGPVRWSGDEALPPVIWAAVLDGRYRAQVIVVSSRTGRLTLRDLLNGSRLLMTRTVALGRASLYGPSRQEVALWQSSSERAVQYQIRLRAAFPEFEP